MSDQPLVSIIIPTYNRAHLIGETLNSVLAQTYQNWECIIVDDGSSDNTDEVVGAYVKRDSRFKYFLRPDEHLPGGNGARNYGFKISQGEYVNWFDSDDLMVSEKLKLQVDYLIKNKNIDVVFCECRNFYLKKNELVKCSLNKIQTVNFIEDYVLRKLDAQTGTALWRKAVLLKQHYDEELLQSQDYEYYSRLFSKSPQIGVLKKPLTLVRKEHDSISNSYLNYDKNKVKSFVKAYTGLIIYYDQNYKIQLTLINFILASLNSNLNLMNDKDVLKYYFDKINQIFYSVPNFKKHKTKWIFLKILSKVLFVVNNGAYKFRTFYKFN